MLAEMKISYLNQATTAKGIYKIGGIIQRRKASVLKIGEGCLHLAALGGGRGGQFHLILGHFTVLGNGTTTTSAVKTIGWDASTVITSSMI